MSYNSGTATDYLDLLGDLLDVITSRAMDSVAVNAGGTGHAIGDIIDIDNTGSTRTHDARIEVVDVSAGVITAARIYRSGAYTVDPTTTTANAQSATTGAGTGATFDITFAAVGWSLLARQSEVDTVDSIDDGGSGYTVGDDLTLVGGVLAPGGSAATFNVDTVSTGAVTAVSILTRGDYEVFPTDPVLTTVSPAGGTGCTLNLTPRDTTGDTRLVLQGDAGAALDPIIGLVTYSNETDESGANSVFNWALFGMSSWSATSALHEQANISPGFNTALDGTLTTSTTGDGSFVPLKDSDAFNIDYWIRASGRNVTLVAKVQDATNTYYAQVSFGLLNQFGVSTEYPYPLYVAAPSDRKRVWYRDTSPVWGGLSTVMSRANGPMFVWAPEGAWIEAKNFGLSANQNPTIDNTVGNSPPRCYVWPLGEAEVPNDDPEDQIWAAASTTGFDNDDLTLASGATRIYRTPNTGGDLFPLYPVTIAQQDESSSGFKRVFGEIDGVFWFDLAGELISSEDRFPPSTTREAHTIFQNGTRTNDYDFMALRED